MMNGVQLLNFRIYFINILHNILHTRDVLELADSGAFFPASTEQLLLVAEIELEETIVAHK